MYREIMSAFVKKKSHNNHKNTQPKQNRKKKPQNQTTTTQGKFNLTKHLRQIEVPFLNISKLLKKNKEPCEASIKLRPHNFV